MTEVLKMLPEAAVFHYTDRPKPVNNFFPLSQTTLFTHGKKTHASVTVTVVRDRKIRTALRTNQIAEFVTVTAWKKIKDEIHLGCQNFKHQIQLQLPLVKLRAYLYWGIANVRFPQL